jgi:hypothetical protein
MADGGHAPGDSNTGDRTALLRQEFLSQTARIPWRELQSHFAHGNVVRVAPALDLVEVAVQLGLDNAAQFQAWIGAGDIAPVSDADAGHWLEQEATLWAVVAAPWILVQDRDAKSGTK